MMNPLSFTVLSEAYGEPFWLNEQSSCRRAQNKRAPVMYPGTSMSLEDERKARDEIKKFAKAKEAEKILDLTKTLRSEPVPAGRGGEYPEMETPNIDVLLGIASAKKESSSSSKKDPRKIIGIHYGKPGDEPYPIYEGDDNPSETETDELLPSYDSLPPSRVGFMTRMRRFFCCGA